MHLPIFQSFTGRCQFYLTSDARKADSIKTAIYRKFNLVVKPNPADGTDSNPDIGVRDNMKPGSRDIVDNLIVAQLV